MAEKHEGMERRENPIREGKLVDLLRFEAQQTHQSKDLLERIYEEMLEMKQVQTDNAEQLKKMAEIMDAWNNAKGFVKTIGAISRTVKWMLVTAGTFAAAYYTVITWLSGKGHS